jgi:hypothetical protein
MQQMSNVASAAEQASSSASSTRTSGASHVLTYTIVYVEPQAAQMHVAGIHVVL